MYLRLNGLDIPIYMDMLKVTLPANQRIIKMPTSKNMSTVSYFIMNTMKNHESRSTSHQA